MTDRAFEPPGENPFARIMEQPAETGRGLDNPAPQDDADNPFAKIMGGPVAPATSATGAFVRGAARSALPALGSMPVIGAGIEAGGALGAPFGPIGVAAGGIVGGLVGGFGGATAIDWALRKLPDSWREPIGLGDRQEKLDQKFHGTASFLGGLVPYGFTMRPGLAARGDVPENATALRRIMAHPLTSHVFGGAVVGGMELGQEAAQGEAPDWTKVGIATGFGVVFNRPTAIGERLTQVGARPVLRLIGKEAPPIPAPAEAPPGAPAAPAAAAPTPSTTAAAEAPPPPPVTTADFRREISERTRTGRPYELSPTAASVPDSAFNGDLERGLTRIFYNEDFTGESVSLPNVGFRPDEISALERAGLAADGAMSHDQFNAWMKERNARLNRGRTVRPPPTVADAADLKVMGPGVTEEVFRGSHEMSPAAEDAARDAKRTEQSVIGPDPTPDVHSVARQMHLELFDRYEDLKRQEAELAGVAPQTDQTREHLATIRRELGEVAPQVAAANRRAAEALSTETVEPPEAAVPSAEIGPDHPIVAEETRRNMAAGIPQEEAQAAAIAQAHMWETRAVRFGGAKGTAAEMYAREAPEVQGGPGVQPVEPVAPEVIARAEEALRKAEAVAPNGQASSDLGMPSPEARSSETGAAKINSSAEAPPGSQPLPGAHVSTRPEPFESLTSRETPPSMTAEANTRTGLRLGDIDPLSNKKILQDSNDFKALHERAKANKERFVSALNDVVKDIPGAELYSVRVKDLPGLEKKITAKGRPASTISDYIGGRITVDDPQALREVLGSIRMPILEYEDFIHEGKSGYRGVHMQLGIGDGMSAELQIVPKSVMEGMKEGHAIRQDVKRLDPSDPVQLEKINDAMSRVAGVFARSWDQEKWQNWGRFNPARTAQLEARSGSSALGYVQRQLEIQKSGRFSLEKEGEYLSNRIKAPVFDPADATLPPQDRAAPVASPLGNTVRMFSPGELKVDAKRFQFKEGGDESGVTDRLKGVKRWDPIKAGMVLVWEDKAGQHFIVDGHQRHGLASRIAGEDPAQNPQLLARVLREADGVTAKGARTIAALKNISEGTGTAIDAAKVLRDDPDLADELPPRSELVRQARDLVNLSKDAFMMVVNDVVPSNYAAIVGKLAPHDSELQSALLGLLAKTEPANAVQAEAIVRQGIEAGTARKAETAQGGLFGDEDVATSLYLDRAKVLDKALKEIKRDKTVFSVLTKEQSSIEEAGNKLAADINQKRAAADAQALQVLQILANRKGPISDALGDAAKRARADGKPTAAVRGFIAQIRAMVESGDLARLADGIERGPTHVGAEDAASLVERAPERGSVEAQEKASDEVRDIEEKAVEFSQRRKAAANQEDLFAPRAPDLFANIGQRIEDATQRVEANPADHGARQELRGLVDQTKIGPQNVLPGMERTAVQAAASREAAGGLRSEKTQQEPGGMFAEREKGQTELFQREAAPAFYSAVSRAIESAKQTKASPQQWLGTLKNMPGVKPEEMEWLGLEDWLKQQKGSVTKDEIADYVRANQIEVKEVEKGGGPAHAFGTPEEQQAATNRLESAQQRMLAARVGTPEWEAAKAEHEAAQAAMRDVVPGWGRPAGATWSTGPGGETKFGSYQLPGGENYRELLLTLPEKPEAQINVVKHPDKPGFALQRADGSYITNEPGTYNEGRPTWFAKQEEADYWGKGTVQRKEGQTFRSSHFDEPNILAHVRFNDRTIDGKKTLFVEEVQSDWHQAGKKRGYDTKEPLQWSEPRVITSDGTKMWSADKDGYEFRVRQDPDGKFYGIANNVNATPQGVASLQEAQTAAERYITQRGGGRVPDAPFKTTWPELAMKRMIRYAAENGYDKVAWTTGETQAARYDLSKQVDSIHAERAENGTFTLRGMLPNGTAHEFGSGIPRDKLADYVGKELAEKIDRQIAETKMYSGVDLKVGGEGMKGFYDQILPATVNKLVKKFGGKTERGNIEASGVYVTDARTGEHGPFATRDAAVTYIHEHGINGQIVDRQGTGEKIPVHSLDISDKLRDAATEQGFPLFQKAKGSYRVSEDPAVRDVITYFKDADASTLIHEPAHGWLNRMMKDAADEAAPAQLKADAKTTLDWLGVTKAEDLDERTAAGKLTARARRANEKFARGFEAYVMEGWAPSQALVRVFEQFRQWLAKIYKSLKQLEEEAGFKIGLTDEMRAVFDRMLAERPRRRTVIAGDRGQPRGLADEHETDAAELAPHEAEAGQARVDAERERGYSELPHDITAEFDASEREAAEPAGAPAEGAGRPGAVPAAGGGPETQPPGGGGGAPSGAERGGVTAPRGEGAGVRETPSGPGSRENAESLPLAPAPAAGFPANTFNVGKDGNVRVENITSVPQFITAIEEAAERVGGGGATTMGDMMALADDLALDPKSLDEAKLASLFGGVKDLSAKIWAFRRAVRAQAETVHNLMQRVGESGGSDEAAFAYGKERDRFDMMYSVLSSVTTEAGRGLGMGFRNMEGWDKVKDIGEFIKGKTGQTLFQLKMEARLGAQLDSPAKVARFLRDAQKRSFGGMLLEYFINALISGPSTHMTYYIGNKITRQIETLLETPLAAAIGATREAFGRQGERVFFGEAAAREAAIFGNIPKRYQAGIEALRTGQPTLLPGQTARPLTPFFGDTGLHLARNIQNDPVTYHEVMGDLFAAMKGIRDGIVGGAELIKAGGEAGAPLVGAHWSPLGQIPDIAFKGVPVLPVGSLLRLPGRGVAAIHSMDTITNYSAITAARAYREALTLGLDGNARASHIANRTANPPQEWMEQAHKEAFAATLMAPGGQFVQRLSALVNTSRNLPGIGEIRPLKFIDPFVHIGANVINKAIVERTPVGLLSSEIRADLSGANGNIAQDTAMARMLAGTALSLALGGLAMEGYASGSGPNEPAKMAMWRLAGNQPHSVRIGDIWYQVNRLGPIGMLISTAADMYDVAHEATQGELLTAAAHLQHAVTQNILDESFMRGPAELLRAIEDPGRYGESYLRSFVSSFVPFSVGMYQIARASDPYARQARTVMDAIKQKIPGQSEKLMPRIDVWGQPIPSPEALGMRGLTAVYETQVSRDPVNKAMLDLGIAPAKLERKIRNVELTDAEYDDFARLAGRMTKLRLDTIVKSPDYQTWPNPIRHDVFAEVIRQTREAARGIMMGKYPHIVRDSVEEMKKRRLGEPTAIH